MKRWIRPLFRLLSFSAILLTVLVAFQNCSNSGIPKSRTDSNTKQGTDGPATIPIPTVEGNGEPYEGKLYTVDANGECGPSTPYKSAIFADGTDYFLVQHDCAKFDPIFIPHHEIIVIKDEDALFYQNERYKFAKNYVPKAVAFSSSSATYLSRVPGQDGNRQIWTISAWVRRTAFGGKTVIFSTTGRAIQLFFDADGDSNRLRAVENGGDSFDLKTQFRYTDPNVWLHIVLSIDTTQAAGSDRAKLFVNGERITAFATSKYPARNKLFDIHGSFNHNIGRRAGGGDRYFNGEMADFYLLDGIAADAEAFGQISGGAWVHRPYTGAFGVNGFHLSFDPPGEDISGNQNHFSPVNF